MLFRDTHGVGGIVQDVLELAGHAADERRQHVGLQELRQRGIGDVVPRAEALAERSTGTILPIVVQSLVAGYQHHGHVLLKGGLVTFARHDEVAVPSRIERKLAVGLTLLVVGRGELASALRTLGEVAQLEHRVDFRSTVGIVGTGHLVAAVVQHGVALQQVGKGAGVLLAVDDIGHVGQRCHHLAHAVDEAVQTTDVLLHNLRSVNRGIATLAVGGVIEQEVVVIVGNLLV